MNYFFIRRCIILILALFLLACTSHQPEEECRTRLDKVLAASWSFYKIHYIQPDGRVQRPDSDNDTVSEGQAYALLRGRLVPRSSRL